MSDNIRVLHPRTADDSRCPDCGIGIGYPHGFDCDVERCPLCGEQLISCVCVYEINDIEHECYELPLELSIWQWGKFVDECNKVGGPLVWTGEWPGVTECIEWGWYSYLVYGTGWIPCEEDYPGASPDLNRLAVDALWDKTARRYVLRH